MSPRRRPWWLPSSESTMGNGSHVVHYGRSISQDEYNHGTKGSEPWLFTRGRVNIESSDIATPEEASWLRRQLR